MMPTSHTGSLALRLEEDPGDIEARAALARIQIERGQYQAATAVLDALPADVSVPEAFATLRQRLSQVPGVVGPAEIVQEGPRCLSCLAVFGLGLGGLALSVIVGSLGAVLPDYEHQLARETAVKALDATEFSERRTALLWLESYGEVGASYLAPFVAPERFTDEREVVEAVALLVHLEPDGSREIGDLLTQALPHSSSTVQNRSLVALAAGEYRLSPKPFGVLFDYVVVRRDRWAELIPLLKRRAPKDLTDLEPVLRQRVLEFVGEAITAPEQAIRSAALRLAPLLKGGDSVLALRVARLALASPEPKVVAAGINLGLHFGLESALDRFLDQTRERARRFSTVGAKAQRRRVGRFSRKLRSVGFSVLRPRYEAEEDPFAKEVLKSALGSTLEGKDYIVRMRREAAAATPTPAEKRP